MPFNRDELVIAELIKQLNKVSIGIIVQRVDNIDVARITNSIASKLNRNLYVSAIGYQATSINENVIIDNSVESAVGWRHQPEKAGKIIVFVNEDVPKMHSLDDLDVLVNRDLMHRLLAFAIADEKLSPNQPQKRFWEALNHDDEIAFYALLRLEEFVQAIYTNHKDPQAISTNLWRLGLLRDNDILNPNKDPRKLLDENRNLLSAVEELSNPSRKRLSINVADQAMQTAYLDLIDYHGRSSIEALKRLDVQTVKELIQKSRPKSVILPQPEPSQVEVEDTFEFEDLEEQEETVPLPNTQPIQGQAIHEHVADYAVRTTPEAQQALEELAETLQEFYENPEEFNDEVLLVDRPIELDNSQDYLHNFIGYVCQAGSWGGVLHTSQESIDNAIRRYTPEGFTVYNPDDPGQGYRNQCVFSLLRWFDEQYIESGTPFTDCLNRFITIRNQLLLHLDLLLEYPFVILGGKPEVRKLVNEYIRAYSDILSNYRQHQATINRHDSTSLRFVTTELLRLDVIHIRTPTECKAMLTPLHPFHLWRLHEIIQSVHNEEKPLTEEEQRQLADAITDLPHSLHFLVASRDVPGFDEAPPLPQSGSIGLLPTYENRTNRYLGTDGLSLLKDLLKRWYKDVPYSQHQIRLALVDPPNLHAALKLISEFLKPARKCSLILYVYATRTQKFRGQLAQLKYHSDDRDIGELMQKERLTINLRESNSINEATTALKNSPVHIAFVFDQAQYNLKVVHKAKHLIVSPLVITYEYNYSKAFKQGSIEPSSEAEDGLFADFHFLIQNASQLRAGEQLRLQHGDDIDMEPINTMLREKTAIWLAVADRVLTNYSPVGAIPLRETRIGQREVAVWAESSSRSVRNFVDFLRIYPLQPEEKTVSNLLLHFGHIAAGEWLTSPRTMGDSKTQEKKYKGLMGVILAVAWYTKRYPESLVCSLDSELARFWLQERPGGNKRADLIGLRIDKTTNMAIIEPIEVKTHADDSVVRSIRNSTTGQRELRGEAIKQLQSMLDVLNPIFGEEDKQPLFTPARREALKYQLHRECYRKIYPHEWQEMWYERLKGVFALPEPKIFAKCEAMVIHIQLEEVFDEQLTKDSVKPITLVRLGTQAVQKLIAPPDDSSSSPDDNAPPPAPAPHSTMTITKQSQSSTPSTINYSSAPISAIKTNDDKTNYLPIKEVDYSEAEELARLFKRACDAYNIQVDQCDPKEAVLGPNVLRFYVRLNRIQRLNPLLRDLQDIEREMRRSGLIITQIPNSNKIALDVPRLDRQTIPISEGLEQLPEITSPEQLPFLIGVSPEGEHIFRDLSSSTLTHLLIAGTTGAGKSVLLTGFLVSLLTTHPNPSTLKLLLCSAAPEDFSLLEGFAHLEKGRIISDTTEAIDVLQNYVMMISDERQQILKSVHCRNIGEYNSKYPDHMPPFIVIVDEFADLADQLAGERKAQRMFYTQLNRIAQGGRKRGIHLVLCTQRPSAKLLPTDIRSNLNGRIALRVNDKESSRMILDDSGAEQLQMKGDLLFKEQATIIRAQSYFVSTENLINFAKNFEIKINPPIPPQHRGHKNEDHPNHT